jgi:hypothetical protein
MRTRLNSCLKILTQGIAALCLAACQTQSMDGRFAPSCPAYAGETLTIDDGTFEWDKFTDEVVVDSAGNKIDKFPQHPINGTYGIEGEQLVFQSGAGIKPDFSHLVQSGDDLYLLTDEELGQWTNDGSIPRCALVFRPTS